MSLTNVDCGDFFNTDFDLYQFPFSFLSIITDKFVACDLVVFKANVGYGITTILMINNLRP